MSTEIIKKRLSELKEHKAGGTHPLPLLKHLLSTYGPLASVSSVNDIDQALNYVSQYITRNRINLKTDKNLGGLLVCFFTCYPHYLSRIDLDPSSKMCVSDDALLKLFYEKQSLIIENSMPKLFDLNNYPSGGAQLSGLELTLNNEQRKVLTDMLLAHLQKSNLGDVIQREIIRLCGIIGSSSSPGNQIKIFNALIPLMQSRKEQIRQEIPWALIRFMHTNTILLFVDRIVPSLISLLQSKDHTIQGGAAYALGIIGKRLKNQADIITALLKLLTNKHHYYPFTRAALALGGLNISPKIAGSIVDSLLHYLPQHRSGTGLNTIISTLGQFHLLIPTDAHRVRVVNALIPFLQSLESPIPTDTIRSLGLIGQTASLQSKVKIIQTVVQFLKNSHNGPFETRLAEFTALINIGKTLEDRDLIIKPLLDLKEKGDKIVKNKVDEALIELGYMPKIPQKESPKENFSVLKEDVDRYISTMKSDDYDKGQRLKKFLVSLPYNEDLIRIGYHLILSAASPYMISDGLKVIQTKKILESQAELPREISNIVLQYGPP